jgi:hypothetical protein
MFSGIYRGGGCRPAKWANTARAAQLNIDVAEL